MDIPLNILFSVSPDEIRVPFESPLVSKFFVNQVGKIIRVNKKALGLFGYDINELIDKNIEIIIPKIDNIATYQYLDKFVKSPPQSQNGITLEIYALHKSGREFPVEIGISSLLSEGQSLTHISVVDISQRIVAETERKFVHQQLQDMLSASNTIVYKTTIQSGYHNIFISDNIRRILGFKPEEFYADSKFWENHLHPDERRQILEECAYQLSHESGRLEYRFLGSDGKYHWISDSFRILHDTSQNPCELLGAWTDITNKKDIEHTRDKLETELRLAHKLEAIGQLASGIAHEINTPLQFVGDSLHFLKSAFEDLQSLIESYKRTFAGLSDASAYEASQREIEESEENYDLAYLQEHMPKAFERTLDGLQHITEIVRAMKEFAHSTPEEKRHADINRALTNTITISRNEYKYVADIETDFGEIPQVSCNIGELNQVFLNLIVNGAHAIGDVVGTTGKKGLIKISTSCESDKVIIAINDNGAGIPEKIHNRIFDPFFTTKPVGKGSGQGLSLCYNIVVTKHGGKLTFETEVGKGTTFFICIPINS